MTAIEHPTAIDLTNRGYADLCTTVCSHPQSIHTKSNSNLPSAPYTCNNCDDTASSIYHHCHTCSTTYCHPCSFGYHRAVKYRTHEITIVQHPFMHQLEPEALHGYGYCRLCYGRDGYIQLATLHCEDCDVLTCLDCDVKQHQYMETNDHSRVYIDDQQVIEMIPLHIATHSINLQYSVDMSSYAGIVWDGSLFLGLYIEHMNAQQPDFLRGKHVIELGSGCAAVPSLTSHILGAQSVVATDMNDSAMQLLSTTIAQMTKQNEHVTLPGTISTQAYSFGDPVDVFSNRKFDYIFGSFLLYIPDVFDELAWSVKQLSHEGTITLFSSHERQREPLFIQSCIKFGLNVEHINIKQFVADHHARCGDTSEAVKGMSSYNSMREVSLLKITVNK